MEPETTYLLQLEAHVRLLEAENQELRATLDRV